MKEQRALETSKDRIQSKKLALSPKKPASSIKCKRSRPSCQDPAATTPKKLTQIVLLRYLKEEDLTDKAKA
jgi:hypothetical protein